jgi:hypothetical protein
MASTKNDPHPHGPHVITYSATLDVPEATAVLLTDLLIAERRRRGTGIGARAASARIQAVLVLRWFRQDIGMPTPGPRRRHLAGHRLPLSARGHRCARRPSP